MQRLFERGCQQAQTYGIVIHLQWEDISTSPIRTPKELLRAVLRHADRVTVSPRVRHIMFLDDDFAKEKTVPRLIRMAFIDVSQDRQNKGM